MTTATEVALDQTGRFIPRGTDISFAKESRGYFKILQPSIDFKAMYARFQKHLGIESPSALEFETKAKALLKEVQGDPAMKGLLSGVSVPFILPRSTNEDVGHELEAHLFPALGGAFEERFPKFRFINHCVGQLGGQIQVAANTRYERLVAARKAGPVVGWYFPTCFAEFSIGTQKAKLQSLSERYVLSGPLEMASALVGCPELLMGTDDNYPYLLCATGVTPAAPAERKYFYHFESYGWNLTFNRRANVGAVSEYWSGGLTFF